jgi:ribosomal protein S18 acetylase RimI-like enzyme
MGYELVGAFLGLRMVGVLGMRPVLTLARGAHLHIDDLIVREKDRKAGIGRALMAFAEKDAIARGLRAVFLDSRQEVTDFYRREGYSPHTSVLMRKRI